MKYIPILELPILILMILIRSIMLSRHGIKAIVFGVTDKTIKTVYVYSSYVQYSLSNIKLKSFTIISIIFLSNS